MSCFDAALGGALRRLQPLGLALVAWLACGPLAASAQSVGVSKSIPSYEYFGAFPQFYEGRYDEALNLFRKASVLRIPTPWIDSICRDAMVGECYYQMGRLDQALEAYTSAVQLYLAYPEFLIRVQLPPSLGPANITRSIPWGPSTRRARLGHFNEDMLIGTGYIDQSEVIQKGGVVQMAEWRSIRLIEILRCLALATRRRAELLGPLSEHDPVTDELVAALTRRPAPPNHWSQAWIDVLLGLALTAANKDVEAVPMLTRGLVAAGEYDHPLTSCALLALGQLALERGEFQSAARFFHEASISSVYYPDPIVLEEAFRQSALMSLLNSPKTLNAVLAPAAQWAKVKNLRQLQASLQLLLAESCAVAGQPAQAAAALDAARAVIGNRSMGAGVIGARMNYLRATVHYQQRNTAAGDEALAAALRYMQSGSTWLLQIRQLDARYAAGQIGNRGPITTRSAAEIYARLLRDPQANDWVVRPMESMASLNVPHLASYEHWFLIALERNEHELALEIADRSRRHRFFSSLPMGARLLALRWILEAPAGVLGNQALLERQSLLTSYPAYKALSQEAEQLRQTLKAAPLVAADTVALDRQGKALAQLGKLAAQQEAMLREMAVRREPASIVFPPVRSLRQIRESLAPGQLVLAFYQAKGDLYAFLFNKDNYDYWRIKSTAALARRIADLLREMGQYDPNRELTVDELAGTKWKTAAEQTLHAILDGSRADFKATFPELVVVPDGVLWYLPFEALQVTVDGRPQSLISRFRVRYAPTAALAVADGRAPNPTGQTAIVCGKLFPRDDPAVSQQAFTELARVLPRSAALAGPTLPGPSSLYGAIMDGLVVWDDLSLDSRGAYGWWPIQFDRNKQGGTLGDWLSLPWRGPELVILPGFHTAAETAMKNVGPAPGADTFLSICGLMSTGARTIVLSRWRPGGQTSVDIIREFVQELPHTTPADAWQRSVLLAAETRLDLAAEPRVKPGPTSQPPTASHPLFWAGYMLVDSGAPGAPADIPAEADEPPAEKAADADKDAAPPPPAEPPEGAPKPAADGQAAPPEDSAPPPAGLPADAAEPAMTDADPAAAPPSRNTRTPKRPRTARPSAGSGSKAPQN